MFIGRAMPRNKAADPFGSACCSGELRPRVNSTGWRALPVFAVGYNPKDTAARNVQC
jgi:hypothetical protein